MYLFTTLPLGVPVCNWVDRTLCDFEVFHSMLACLLALFGAIKSYYITWDMS